MNFQKLMYDIANGCVRRVESISNEVHTPNEYVAPSINVYKSERLSLNPNIRR